VSGPTFDEELLLWLGDEPEAERAADGERVREIAAEFARGFDALSRIGPASGARLASDTRRQGRGRRTTRAPSARPRG
jgi:hypothetical protein